MTSFDAPQTPPTPTGHQRTTGGNFRWEPPTPEELQAMMPGYTIEKLLGRGGMGAVYKGVQQNLDRTVAIKVLPPGVEKEDPSFAERFKNEAKLMAKLLHPAVVAVFDFGTTSGGLLYIAMEYVDGSDVSRMIAQQGKLPPEHALAITAHVCDALAAAHELGIVHRDIKPANVLLNMKGQVKVADFGLAKVEEPGQHGLTKTGYAMGTPDFVAPEVLMLGSSIDGRADLYAVGVMLYQMLTGEVPRGAFKPATARVPGLDRRYDPIIMKAMQSDREERYQSSAELRRDLDVILTVPLVKQDDPASAAIPVSQVAQMPAQRSAAQKPVGKPPQQSQKKPAAASPNPKSEIHNPQSKTPLLLGLGIAAAVAIGAFILFSGGNKPAPNVVQASGLPPQAAGTAATPSPAPAKAAEPPRSESKPIVSKPTPTVVAATPPKPAPEKKAEPTATTITPSLPAAAKAAPPVPHDVSAAVRGAGAKPPAPMRLPDPAKWVKMQGSEAGINKGASFTITTKQMRDVAVRAKLTPRPKAPHNSPSIMFRVSAGNASYNATVQFRGEDVSLIKGDGSEGKRTVAMIPLVPPHDMSKEFTLEVIAVEKVIQVSFNGKVTVQFQDDAEPVAGTIHVYNPDGIARDVEWQSLDATPEEILAAAKAMEQQQVAQAAASIPELTTLDEQLKQFSAERVSAPFVAEVAKLNTSYLNGLDRKMAEEKAAGHLDSVLALEAEKQRVTDQQPIPSAEDDATSTTTPAVLKGLRQIYREAYAKIEATRAANLKALTDPLTTRLKLLESDLTKKDRIADAKTVKEYREGLGQSGPLSPLSGTSVPTATGTAQGTVRTTLNAAALKDGITNTLGMKFLPVKGTEVMFCVHETRRQDYAAFANEVPGLDGAWKNQQRDGIPCGHEDNHPVVGVSWEDARKFCEWLSKKEARPYRLPTDEEWSIAVGLSGKEKHRNDATPEMLHRIESTEFPWGLSYPPKTKDQAGNYSDSIWHEKFPALPWIKEYSDGFPTTAPVMSFQANKFGLYDMGGNAWEWVEDWWNLEKKHRVLRGAAFDGEGSSVLSSSRHHESPGRRMTTGGFRVVLETN